MSLTLHERLRDSLRASCFDLWGISDVLVKAFHRKERYLSNRVVFVWLELTGPRFHPCFRPTHTAKNMTHILF